MATQQPAQGTGKQKRRGFFPYWVRVVACIFTFIFLIVAATIWIWKVWGDISATMSALFAVLGVIFAFLTLLSVFFPSGNRRSDSSDDIPVLRSQVWNVSQHSKEKDPSKDERSSK